MEKTMNKLKQLFKPEVANITLIGLEYSGKSSLISNLNSKTFVAPKRTKTLDVKQIKCNKKIYQIYDYSGKLENRKSWFNHIETSSLIIYVIDASKHEKLDENIQQILNLFLLIKEDNKLRIPVLFLANKQDIPGALTAYELVLAFKLNEIDETCWNLEPCCAISGHGVDTAFNWVYKILV